MINGWGDERRRLLHRWMTMPHDRKKIPTDVVFAIVISVFVNLFLDLAPSRVSSKEMLKFRNGLLLAIALACECEGEQLG